jgi:hypothetical protein
MNPFQAIKSAIETPLVPPSGKLAEHAEGIYKRSALAHGTSLYIIRLAMMSLEDLSAHFTEGDDAIEECETRADVERRMLELHMIAAIGKYRFGKEWVRP